MEQQVHRYMLESECCSIIISIIHGPTIWQTCNLIGYIGPFNYQIDCPRSASKKNYRNRKAKLNFLLSLLSLGYSKAIRRLAFGF